MTLDKNQKRRYVLEPYNPDWVVQFESIKGRLISVFGTKAIKIEHVGSTSITGMFAKPLIDVLVVVQKMEAFEKEIAQMVALGYEYGRDYIAPNTLLFFKTDGGDQKLENIHVCESGTPKERQFLVMRDFFREFPDKAREYSQLKKKNFEQFSTDYPAYRKAKEPFLQKMEQEAYKWFSNK